MSKILFARKSLKMFSRSVVKNKLVLGLSMLMVSSFGFGEAYAQGVTNESAKPADNSAAADPESALWNAYLVDLEKQILGKWFPPKGVALYKSVNLEIRIRKDGQLSKADITRSSQILAVDEAAKKAVQKAAPYKPFPDGVKKEDFERFEVKLGKAQVNASDGIVRKLEKGSKLERDDHREKQSF